MQTVAVAAFDGVVAFDLAIPCHVFGVVEPAAYEVLVCGTAPAHAAGAFDIAPRAGLAELADAGTVVVPGIDDPIGGLPGDELVAALRAAHARGARMVSICTGAFALAAAGLLAGRRVATHWQHSAELARRHPELTVAEDVLYVDDGDVLTSAGVAAGIDLCLHLVARDHGAEAAGRAARRVVVPPHRDGGQAQFIERPLPAAAGTTLDATREWMLAALGRPVTVAEMAAHAGWSERTFARRFRAETGTSPLRWLLAERLRAARRMLERGDESIEAVAGACGFGSATGLRQHFARACGTTPTAYRAAFRGRV